MFAKAVLSSKIRGLKKLNPPLAEKENGRDGEKGTVLFIEGNIKSEKA